MRTSTNLFFVAVFGILFLLNSVLGAPIPRRHSSSTASASASSSTESTSSSSSSSSASSSNSNSTDDTSGSTDSSSSTSSSNATSSSSSGSGSGVGSGPWFAVYTDRGPDPAPAVSDIQGFNVVIMSFLLSTGATDMAMAWQQMSASQRSTIKQQYQAAGIKLLVSAFGSTEQPTTSGADATQLASTMAAWVKEYGVDGIDVDYEDETAMDKGDGSAETWLVDFTNGLRSALPQGQYILTHAPQAPWMGPSASWAGGAYITVNKQVGSQIDWYNTQFYNQGTSEYTTCDGLLTASTSSNPKSSVFEIEANGFDLNKIVIGKPGAQADASNGQMDTGTLAGCVSQAKAKGWNAGVMSWEYPDANSAWITAVRGSAYPSGGSSSSSSSSSSSGDGDSGSASASSNSTDSNSGSGSTTSSTDGDGASSSSSSSSSGTTTTSPPEQTSGSGTTGASDNDSSSNNSTTGSGSSGTGSNAGSDSNSGSNSSTPQTTSSTTSPTDDGSGSSTNDGSGSSTADGASPTNGTNSAPGDTDTSSPNSAPGGDSNSTSTDGESSSGDSSSPTATINNGMWTPSATPTTFNNGMWTPSADAPTATGTGTGSGQGGKHSKGKGSKSRRSRSRMVRRRLTDDRF